MEGSEVVNRRITYNELRNRREAVRRWEHFHKQWDKKYKWIPQYEITGLTHKEWLKKTKEVAIEKGRTHEQVQKSPFYRWTKNPAFARLDERRQEIANIYTASIERAKQSYQANRMLMQRYIRSKGRMPLTAPQRLYISGNLWRWERNLPFSKLGPAGFFSENTVIRIDLDPDIATFAALIYPSIKDDQTLILKIQDDILNKVIIPTVRHGVILISKYVPMMTGELRKTMLEALRNYKKFQYPEPFSTEIFVHTIGIMYSRPVNNMPTFSLKHPRYGELNFRRKDGIVYYLNDPDAETEWFKKVVDEMRSYAKERWNDFEAFLLRALNNFRLLKEEEAIYEANLQTHDPGDVIQRNTEAIRTIVATMFPRLRAIDTIMSKYETMKKLKQQVLPAKRNVDNRYTRVQHRYIENIINETIYGDPRKLNTKTFIGLFIRVKHNGGTYR